MILLFLAAAAAEPANSPAEQAYINCIMSEAEQLTPSQESAETISGVALTLCSERFDAALKSFNSQRMQLLHARGVTGTLEESREMLEQLARKLAVTAVVVKRAKADKP